MRHTVNTVNHYGLAIGVLVLSGGVANVVTILWATNSSGIVVDLVGLKMTTTT